MRYAELPGYAILRDAAEVALGLMAWIWLKVFGSSRVAVLAYHSVSHSDWIHAVEPGEFKAQMEWLKSSCNPVGLDVVSGGVRKDGKPKVAVTFDDGYCDWLGIAAPIMKENGIPATFFVTTNFESATSVPHAGLKVMKPDEVRELARLGFDIGSHSHTHRDLSQCTQDELCYECGTSKKMLIELSGQDVKHFSYPKGRYSEAGFPTLREFGYVMAFAGHGAVGSDNHPLCLPRIPVTRNIRLWRFKSRVYRALAWGRI